MSISTLRLGPLDRDALARHFLALDREDRRLRFGAAASDEALREYVARIDFEHDGIFAVHDEGLRLVAVIHVACAGPTAELGLSVLPDWRGKGAGNALFERTVTFLRNRGNARVFVHCLAENAAMMHIARKHGMKLLFSGGESEALLELPPATADSYISEWLEDQRAQTVHLMRHNARLARLLLRPTAAIAP